MPFISEEDDLSEEEIEREMVNIYRKSNLDKLASLQNVEKLELKEIEELESKHQNDTDYV